MGRGRHARHRRARRDGPNSIRGRVHAEKGSAPPPQGRRRAGGPILSTRSRLKPPTAQQPCLPVPGAARQPPRASEGPHSQPGRTHRPPRHRATRAQANEKATLPTDDPRRHAQSSFPPVRGASGRVTWEADARPAATLASVPAAPPPPLPTQTLSLSWGGEKGKGRGAPQCSRRRNDMPKSALRPGAGGRALALLGPEGFDVAVCTAEGASTPNATPHLLTTPHPPAHRHRPTHTNHAPEEQRAHSGHGRPQNPPTSAGGDDATALRLARRRT